MNSGRRSIPLTWLAMRLWHRIYTDIIRGHRGLNASIDSLKFEFSLRRLHILVTRFHLFPCHPDYALLQTRLLAGASWERRSDEAVDEAVDEALDEVLDEVLLSPKPVSLAS